MKWVDLLGPATKVGEELMGIPSLTLQIILSYLLRKDMIVKLKKAFMMVAGSAVQKFELN
jgi:hypothetical protein